MPALSPSLQDWTGFLNTCIQPRWRTETDHGLSAAKKAIQIRSAQRGMVQCVSSWSCGREVLACMLLIFFWTRSSGTSTVDPTCRHLPFFQPLLQIAFRNHGLIALCWMLEC